jgi:tetratricopeptide (TPR) repeat protein
MMQYRPLLLGILLISTLAADKPARSLISSANAGVKLSDDQAGSIETKLRKTPDDPELHAQLLGYFQARKTGEHEARTKQILWMIANRPADTITTTAYCMIDAADDPDDYAKAKEAWDSQLGSHSTDPVITANGAAFRAVADFPDAQSLLEKAESLDPKNELWPERLAQLDEQRMAKYPAEAATLAADALGQRQSAYKLTPDPQRRFHVLIHMPEDAMLSENLIQARRLGNQLVGTAEKFQNDPEYGDAIHRGNIVLGEESLEAGNVDRAEQYLAAAGDTPGSASLATVGPDLHLAKRLLARGERTAVRSYLAQCTKFWKDGEQRLKDWISALDTGGTPAW